MGQRGGWHPPVYYRRVYVSFRDCILLLVIVSIFTISEGVQGAKSHAGVLGCPQLLLPSSIVTSIFTIADGCAIAKDTRGNKGLALCFLFQLPLMPGHPLQQVSRQLINSHAHLRHVVTLTYRHRRIVQCREIDCDAVGRADLVLAT